ncbi:hypothetical protein SRHO_G00255870 [Serrasalmus rhombeus]
MSLEFGELHSASAAASVTTRIPVFITVEPWRRHEPSSVLLFAPSSARPLQGDGVMLSCLKLWKPLAPFPSVIRHPLITEAQDGGDSTEEAADFLAGAGGTGGQKQGRNLMEIDVVV